MRTHVLISNTCSRSKVEARYEPLVEDVILTYQHVFGADLIDVRLMGSVARGEAIAGQSDVDFLALLHTEPPAAILQELTGREQRLGRQYRTIGRVDLEAERLATLSEFRSFVVSSDSISVLGTDRLLRRRQSMDRRRLARLVTPDARVLIGSYRAALEHLEPDATPGLVARYARVTGKDLLKCLRGHALLCGAAYEKNIGAIYRQIGVYAPEYRQLADALYSLYRSPGPSKDAILQVLDQAMSDLLPPRLSVAPGPSLSHQG
jgi:predicted nucleotidyltransferase